MLMPNHNGMHQELHTWKEIQSQAEVWQEVLRLLKASPQADSILERSSARDKWIFVGCGTSFYLAEAAALSWTGLTGNAARAIPGSEVLLYPEVIRAEGDNVQAVVISRSGATSEAVRAANVLRRNLGIPTMGITCAENSALEKECQDCLVLRAADEKSTVMTRSFTSMLIALQFLAATRAGNATFIEQLAMVAQKFAPRVQSVAAQVEAFVETHSFADYVFLGQGAFHGIAREAALKVMEMSCSYSQVFHTLEFRHGPKAIVSPATCLTFLLSEKGAKAEAEVLLEMKELGGVIVTVCDRASDNVKRASDLTIEMNFSVNELALLSAHIVPAQLMGLFTGTRKGLNPDAPKNLNRVVMLD